MKIKFNQDYAYSFDGINSTTFKQGHIYDVKDDFAELMIERGYAVNAEPKKIEPENKMAHIESMKSPPVDTKPEVKEHKAEVEQEPKPVYKHKFKKRRGRPKKK